MNIVKTKTGNTLAYSDLENPAQPIILCSKPTPDTIFIGIDPGASGAIAAIYPDGNSFTVEYDSLIKSRDILRCLKNKTVKILCVVELVGGYIGTPQPGSRMFSFGRNFGNWEGLLSALQIQYILIRPQEWQKSIQGLSGLKGPERKRALRDYAAQQFPSIKVTLANADALLLAQWAKKNYFRFTK